MNCMCGMNHPEGRCYESRLQLGASADKKQLLGSLDRQSLKPIELEPIVQANETVTSMKYSPDLRAIVFSNEAARRGGSPDYVESREILAGANVSELGGVEQLVEGSVATVSVVDNQLKLSFVKPAPLESGEVSSGFITYVTDPNDGRSILRLIRPDTDGTNDSILIGRANGSVEFSTPIDSPLVVPANTLTSNGAFAGTPGTASGTWRYQLMGTSQIVTNNSGSPVEVTLNFRFSLTTAGSRSGVYATLNNGGADYKTTFISGQSNEKQEGYPGGYGEFVVRLEANQKCQFVFGAWTNAAGNMEVTIGSIDESGGTTVKKVIPPTIRIRRLI